MTRTTPIHRHAAWLATTLIALAAALWAPNKAFAESDVQLADMPDYDWHGGCFGTANGNLFGFWDRHGLPNFYTGPTGGGLAPLNDLGANANIYAMWASRQGLDGRPMGQHGHTDDYYVAYESTAADPYVTAGRTEHKPDCIGDFIGLSQKKWSDLNGECAGNIDAYSFVYWDDDGDPRVNYNPPGGVTDIQSGLMDWVRHCGYEADVLTQFTEFNPNCAPGKGFTYEDVKREIDNGYPIMIFLQHFNSYSRPLGSLPNANPLIHGICIYGYAEKEFFPGEVEQNIYVRTSWASGRAELLWDGGLWLAGLPARGVIVVHPKPKITHIDIGADSIILTWDGPFSQIVDNATAQTTEAHQYVVEHSTTLETNSFSTVAGPMTARQATVPHQGAAVGFYRVSLMENRP